MSPTNRTLSGPNVSTPADLSGPEAAERPPGSASPTADAAASCKTFRLECPSGTDFSPIVFLRTPVDLHRVRLRTQLVWGPNLSRQPDLALAKSLGQLAMSN